MGPLEERLSDLVEPVVTAEGYDFVRVRVTGGRSKTLQVMAERPDGTMTAANCAALSRALSPVLEEADPIEGNYNLEVSSPGIDRPLVRLSDFDRWQGWSAKLELDRMVEGRKRFSGVLAGVDEGNVAMDIEGETQTALFPFDWIVNAKLVLSEDLIRESLKASKTDEQTSAGEAGEENDEMSEKNG